MIRPVMVPSVTVKLRMVNTTTMNMPDSRIIGIRNRRFKFEHGLHLVGDPRIRLSPGLQAPQRIPVRPGRH